MSLSLLQTYTAIAWNQGLTVPFGATGGTAPYTYTITKAGAGGSIDGSSGLYTAPNAVGVDVIQVEDSLGATASGSIAVLTPLQLVADIIKTCMGLASNQVYIYQQKFNIPIDENLYIAVGVNYLKPFGNRTKYVGGSNSLTAVQSVNMLASLDIHILSRSTKALELKEQVLLALSSTYAEQQMELNSFFVAPVSTSFVNLSKIDATAIPYHFVISTNLQYFNTLTTQPAYFDSFQGASVTTDASPYVAVLPAPGQFRILYASADPLGDEVSLVWTLSPNATSYRVLRGSVSGSWPTLLGSTIGNEFIDGAPPADETSYYMVEATNATGSTQASMQASVVIPMQPPGQFSITSATPGNAQVVLNWATSNNASEYVVVRGTTSGTWPTTVGSTAALTFTDSTATNYTTYYYQVVAVNSAGSQFALAQASAMPELPVPGAFSISGVSGIGGSTTVVWGSAQYASQYVVSRGTTSGTWPTVVGSTAALSLVDTSTTTNTTYYYSVVGGNPTGSTRSSNQGSITTPPPPFVLTKSVLYEGAPEFVQATTAAMNFSKTSAFTIGLWFNIATLSTFSPLIDKTNAGLGQGYLLYVHPDSSLRFGMLDSNGNFITIILSNTGVITPGTWYYATITKAANTDLEGADFHIYIDGVDQTVTNSTVSTSEFQNNAAPLVFGQSTVTGNSYAGYEANLAAYTVELNSTQVSALYAGAHGAPPTPNLEWWYPQGTGDTYPTLRNAANPGTDDATMMGMTSANITTNVP